MPKDNRNDYASNVKQQDPYSSIHPHADTKNSAKKGRQDSNALAHRRVRMPRAETKKRGLLGVPIIRGGGGSRGVPRSGGCGYPRRLWLNWSATSERHNGRSALPRTVLRWARGMLRTGVMDADYDTRPSDNDQRAWSVHRWRISALLWFGALDDGTALWSSRQRSRADRRSGMAHSSPPRMFCDTHDRHGRDYYGRPFTRRGDSTPDRRASPVQYAPAL
jgi:hypothetical protein